MGLNAKWSPMYWPCGPKEVARVGASNSGSWELKKVAEGWAHPSALQLLKGTPVNCLLVEWASGAAADKPQQQALQPLLDAGRALGLSFVGKVSAKANPAQSAAAGRAAGLEAVMLEGGASQDLDLPAILEFPRDSIDWDGATGIYSTTGNVWPEINLPTMKGDIALGGPTGDPWVNSNGWFSLLARRMAPEKSLWLSIDLPDFPGMLPAEKYCLAIADSRVYGARGILSLDGQMRTALLNGDAPALDAWSRISETLSFFDRHAAWESYEPMGVLAVVSDFTGSNAFMAGETLNLLNRHQTQFVILDRRRALADPVTKLKAVLWMDDDEPNPAQARNLIAFVRQGGLFIAPKYWGPAGIKPHQEDWLFGYEIYNLGQGRIVVAPGGFSDPYQLAIDAHLLLGRENDLSRLYNPNGTNCYTSMGPDGRELVQILNYSPQAATYVALWIKAKARGAKLWSPHAQASTSLAGISASQGTSFDLPTVLVHCAVEIERTV